MSKRRKRLAFLLLAAGILMLAGSAVWMLHNSIEKSEAEAEAGERTQKVAQVIEDRIKTQGSGESSDDSFDDSLALPPAEAKKKTMPAVEIDGYEYIGYLELPTLGERVAVMSGYSDAKLKVSACRYSGSLETDDLVIAGHNYMSGFCQLGDLKLGDTVKFTNMDGKTYTYTVAESEMLSPVQVDNMVQSGFGLSLFTCNYTGSDRYTVRCQEGKTAES